MKLETYPIKVGFSCERGVYCSMVVDCEATFRVARLCGVCDVLV